VIELEAQMVHPPKVSIILPSYNRAHLLPRAIRSVLNQDYQDWELLIWDDGSTDETRQVVATYKDERIKYYFETNHGAAYARNRAVEKASGDLLAFLDSDDEWKPEKLTLQVAALNSHPEIDVLFTDFSNIHEHDGKVHHTFVDYQHALQKTVRENCAGEVVLIQDGFPASIATDNYIALDSVMLRHEVYSRAGGFNETLLNSEDFEFWWRLALDEHGFGYIERELLTRYKAAGSLSSNRLPGLKNHLRALDLCVEQAMKAGRPEYAKLLEVQYRNTWQLLMAHYAKQGDFSTMYKALRKSLSYGFRPGTIRLLISSLVTGLRSNRRKA